MTGALLEVRGLRMQFAASRRGNPVHAGPRPVVRAVDGIDLEVPRREVLGLVGESGCGKSTIAWCIAGLHKPTGGEIRFDGRLLPLRRERADRRRIQMIFQDPYSSLNPRMTVGQMLTEILRAHRMRPRAGVEGRARELLQLVGLGGSAMDSHPRQLSGGQRQRASIARALALEPELLIADEPLSALDVSVQATILNLLRDLQEQLGLTMLFISHNLAVVRHICDDVAVMYLGRIVETAEAEELFTNPRHPYTQGLLRSIPRLVPVPLSGEPAVRGELPSPLRIPRGCRFHPRCPLAAQVCTEVDPLLVSGPDDHAHTAACHFAWSDVVEAR